MNQAGGCRYKEEAEGALQESRDQLAAALEQRHALERQARDQVRCSSLFQSDLGTVLSRYLMHIPKVAVALTLKE